MGRLHVNVNCCALFGMGMLSSEAPLSWRVLPKIILNFILQKYTIHVPLISTKIQVYTLKEQPPRQTLSIRRSCHTCNKKPEKETRALYQPNIQKKKKPMYII
ncbi:hypothetical protein ACOSQ2_013217 [Xanthoceras sorbifolium]